MQPGISLFSPQAIGEKHNRALLIQFLSSEIIESHQAVLTGNWEALMTLPPRFFPYDWGTKIGHLNKIQEHGLVLKRNFPDLPKAVKNFEKALAAAFTKQGEFELQRIFQCLEPFIEVCKEDENLLFFLLKNRQTLEALGGNVHNLFLKIHPGGLEILGEKMCDQYHQRGFFSQISEFKLLLTELIHARPAT